ncbi:hypothetical protein HOP50_11g61600 [Chloropicon primus]|uniref:Uncharacterized protein n=1 Tax=Chloropicon primus TaxID=1764295 RepID=A0A5B8MVX5_9CHLO|nr:hypothetical protein A3770_11p61380 [Chloropicon primus]UPR02833.1 hypothetical protein HOP50_11g61600 [Chloropicon primus]|eukprot:QDZ23620.1 hypothetical protein A3770_11p61380 [Chloropicon primus]
MEGAESKVEAARSEVEKSLLLASLQDYNEKLVMEVTKLREENETLLLALDEKDGLLVERDAHFAGAKGAIDRSIQLLKANVVTSLRERDEATSRVKASEALRIASEERVRRLESSLAESKAEVERQKELVSRSLRALAKHKVASTLALQKQSSKTASPLSIASGSPQATPTGEDERDLVKHMEVEHLLDTVGSTLQQKILSDKCQVLESQVCSVNTILKDERDYRLLLEQRQGASQRTISQLISLLFVDKSESQRKKQLLRSLVAAAGAATKGKKATPSLPSPLRVVRKGRQKGSSGDSSEGLSMQALDNLLETNSEAEAMRRAHFRLILNLLEDELHLLDMHYDRLLQEKERKKDEDTSRYVQSLIDRILEEIKEKGAQVRLFSALLKKS